MSITPPQPIDDATRLAWLRLSRSERVGPIAFAALLARYGTAAAALEALPDLSRRGGRRKPHKVCSVSEAERELAALEALGGRLLLRGGPGYPAALAAVEDAPPVLTARGRPDMLASRAIGVVGARNASANGRRLAASLARALGESGLVVVSGLARGIDTAAHEASLATGTVAAMAGGPDVVYPEENRSLYDAILDQGAVVSEMPPGAPIHATLFPRRNRIISGLSVGVLVVEAAERSGSLITARLAGEHGREVLAVPGSPLDPRARGCNRLLREGATLVETAEDVLAALRTPRAPGFGQSQGDLFDPPPSREPAADEAAAARRTLLEALGPAPVPVDELTRRCQLSAPLVRAVLLELELAGRIDRHPGNQVSLVAAMDDGAGLDQRTG